MTASGMNSEFVVQGTLIPARQHQGEEEMPGTVDTIDILHNLTVSNPCYMRLRSA